MREQILYDHCGSSIRPWIALQANQLIIEGFEAGFVLFVIRALGLEQVLQSLLHLQHVVLVILLPLHVQGFVSLQPTQDLVLLAHPQSKPSQLARRSWLVGQLQLELELAH